MIQEKQLQENNSSREGALPCRGVDGDSTRSTQLGNKLLVDRSLRMKHAYVTLERVVGNGSEIDMACRIIHGDSIRVYIA